MTDQDERAKNRPSVTLVAPTAGFALLAGAALMAVPVWLITNPILFSN